MPYINKDRRADFDELLKTARLQRMDTSGELNYLFSVLAQEYLKQHGYNYTQLNTVIGALECAKLELYRRQIVPFEEEKRAANGDVFTDDPYLATE